MSNDETILFVTFAVWVCTMVIIWLNYELKKAERDRDKYARIIWGLHEGKYKLTLTNNGNTLKVEDK